jgi:hypothetical protein
MKDVLLLSPQTSPALQTLPAPQNSSETKFNTQTNFFFFFKKMPPPCKPITLDQRCQLIKLVER